MIILVGLLLSVFVHVYIGCVMVPGMERHTLGRSTGVLLIW